MKPLTFTITAALVLALMAISAVLFMWATIFLCPLILVPVIFIALRGTDFCQIHRPAGKELSWKP